MKSIRFIIAFLAVGSLALTGCKKEGATSQASNVKFNITDAPANFDALNIDVQAIKVHSQASGWVTLQSQLGVINILNYVNGNSTLVAQGNITAGTIDQVQLVLGNNNSVVVNGNTHSLSAASSLLSGLTINMNGNLQAGGQYNFTIDFDAAQSVTAATSGSFSFTPTIRLIVDSVSLGASSTSSGSGSVSTGGNVSVGTGGTGISVGGSTSGGTSTGGTIVVNAGTSGTVTGSISPQQLASVCITGSNGSSFCTMTNLSGQFTLQAVGSGNYSITITPVLPLVNAKSLSNISVSAGQTTNIGVVSM